MTLYVYEKQGSEDPDDITVKVASGILLLVRKDIKNDDPNARWQLVHELVRDHTPPETDGVQHKLGCIAPLRTQGLEPYAVLALMFGQDVHFESEWTICTFRA